MKNAKIHKRTKKHSYELYIKQDEELSKRDLSNVENLDKAILSLSFAY